MDEPRLPSDPSSWPKDPYRLLGVKQGVSPRALRSAYLKLVRNYKPEHSPEKFRLIREAYETALRHSQIFGGSPEIEVEPEPDPEDGRQAPQYFSSSPPSTEPWEWACLGDVEGAYKELALRHDRGQVKEEVYLQLYWLLATQPLLDPERPPHDWLVQGLPASWPANWRIRELLKREVAADPDVALGPRVASLLAPRTPPELLVQVAGWRWTAARKTKRSDVILVDLKALRMWAPRSEGDQWPRLLALAALNLAWKDQPDRQRVTRLLEEVERVSNAAFDLSEDLFQVEYVLEIVDDLHTLNLEPSTFTGLHRLLSLSWDDHDPEVRKFLRSYHQQIARNPVESLHNTDLLQKNGSALIGRLVTLVGDSIATRHPRDFSEQSKAVLIFLGKGGWRDYAGFRPRLLEFCLLEMISPRTIGLVLANRPDYVLGDKSLLVHSIEADWSLTHVYRACEATQE